MVMAMVMVIMAMVIKAMTRTKSQNASSANSKILRKNYTTLFYQMAEKLRYALIVSKIWKKK